MKKPVEATITIEEAKKELASQFLIPQLYGINYMGIQNDRAGIPVITVGTTDGDTAKLHVPTQYKGYRVLLIQNNEIIAY